ncbi:MAG: lytic transglycosylase domain-containing protein [Alphaproteobacteria bacterium]|nr:lytic transglycosylase domain-containing protein [Alphaproteobacteria bacterium]MBL6938209.1 lytic transglycosylase domain-containing protein [Alphaproteobacteria bacterium]MBL7097265.1 lytic transglycosylase domain-containing protein [Alphaproteobacteria bacterium]
MAIVLALPIHCGIASAHTADTVPEIVTDRYGSFIAEASQRFGLPASWLRAVMQVESGGNPKAVSPKGAMGLMQLMPDTWSTLRLQYHLRGDPLDPHDNVLAGAAYLRALFDRFGAPGFLAAYNAGPKRFQDYLAGLQPLHDETKRYLSTLARMLPDLPVNGATLTVATVSDWRSAGLFAEHRTDSRPSTPTPSSSPLENTSSALHFALAPQSNGLFVPVHMTDRP